MFASYWDSFIALTALLTVTMLASMMQLFIETHLHTGFVNVGFLLVFTGVPWFIFGISSTGEWVCDKVGKYSGVE